MIVINEESPRWLREFARFAQLKNLLFVYGNIHDLVSFPVVREPGVAPAWSYSDLPGFLTRYFLEAKYEIVASTDPVDDLTFASPPMEALYRRIEKGKAPVAGKTETADPHAAEAHPPQLPEEMNEAPSPTETQPTQSPAPKPGKSSDGSNWPRMIDGMAAALRNPHTPCAFIVNLASRLASAPAHLTREERALFTKLLRASLGSREVVRDNGRWNNLLVLICDKMNDLPTFLYINNPRSRSIAIETPDRDDRMRFIRRYYRHFCGADKALGEAPQGIVGEFVDLTEGMTNYEMNSLVSLSVKESIAIADPDTKAPNIKRITEMYKYGVSVSEWDKLGSEKLGKSQDIIRARIKGQTAAVARMLDIIKRAKFGLAAGESHKSNRPRGVLFFAGPTGVGKTEMAKALAELLFGREDRLIRFDMSEYAAQHADQRLLGAPPGYVGYEEGGQLTNALKKNPFAILLFDEVEKAHGSILDKFLQILDDGRLTDGKGETVYFSECIIIFTSNLGTISRSEDGTGTKALVTPETPYMQMREIVLGEIVNHFNFVLGRPEILNRFGDNFVVFDFIRPPLDADIVDLLIAKLVNQARESKKLELEIDGVVRDKLVAAARRNLQHGGRGIRNILDAALVNPLSRALFDQNVQPDAQVRVKDLCDHGEDAAYRYEVSIEVTPG